MIKSGSIVRSHNWREPVEIKLIEESGEYIHIVGATIISRDHVDAIITKEEFSKLSIEGAKAAFSEEPWKIFLALETMRYRFASLYDPLLAMNASKADPLPHQIEAVYGYVLKLPRIRFLIADDPGAGKTIMAGLIIKELKLRNLVRRILIVSPGHLKDQWRREMTERFEERFLIIDRSHLDAAYAENVWRRENQIITSIDFAKREDVLPSLSSAHFDLIVVDEAHKMSAYKYGEKTDKTARYKMGEVLSNITQHFLFLTATPHKGDPDNFRLFLDLLDPGFFATNDMLEDSIANNDNPLFIRRVKEEMKDFEGRPLFLPRHAQTVPFNLGINSPAEKNLYNKLSKYVNEQYNKALTKDKRRNITFALVILQRRLASSTYALLKSLQRRKDRLLALLKDADKFVKNSEKTFDFDVIEDMSEKDRWEQERIWETLSVSENREELEKEIETIDGLIDQAKEIVSEETEIKLKSLRDSLKTLAEKYPEGDDKKILIFTESKDTLDYLSKKIHDWGYRTNVIHGGMKLEERVNAEKVFKNETQILVATEAAGEGINLQFCHLMVNYDIPWNPNRLEQRMGRIHRYGQTKEVYVYNLVASDTREGRVLSRLFEKLDEIRKAYGSDKVFDVLSDVLYDTNLSQLLMEAAANARDIDEILTEIDIIVDDEYIAKVKDNLGESLATRYIDYTRIKEMAQRAKEHRLIPEYTESFFKKAFTKAEGKWRERKDGFLSIDSIPFDIRTISEEDSFKRSFGTLTKKYPLATFDKDISFKNPESEFLTFGHPLFEAVMIWIERNFSSSLLNGAIYIDPDRLIDGHILFYEGEIKDGTGSIAGKRLFALYIANNEVKSIAPSIIWDLVEGEIRERPTVDVESLKSKATSRAIGDLEKYKAELLEERHRQAQIKKKYGIKSLEHLIVTLDGDLIPLIARRDQGEKVDIVINNKMERKAEYEKALRDLNELIEKEQRLTMSSPRFRGIIKVLPAPSTHKAMKSDPEVERVAMEISMEYEVKSGRIPEDVSAQNLGFDIRSVGENDEIRYIEVKGRSGEDAVALTQNEWFKARRFRDEYYLYAVMNTMTTPQLYAIKNPAENVQAEEKIEAVRFMVPFSEIAAKGERESG